MDKNLWPNVEHALSYLARADSLPHRTDGEALLLSLLPDRVERVLDLGCGDGRLLALVRTAHPEASGIGVDFSPVMLARARDRFSADPKVRILAHDLDRPLPDLGAFDAVVSSFAIHHVADVRKKSLYAEIFRQLKPGGLFANLEHVASPTQRLHLAFLAAVGVAPADDDPSNKLVPVPTQIGWLAEVGFVDADCLWKWREFALLTGVRER